MNVDEFVARLEGARRIPGGYVARCPAHEDSSPSLSISAGDDGRVLLHCWAGCTTAAVLAALGLSFRDLFSSQSAARRQKTWRR